MRNLFMSPRNWFRMEEAVLSLLAGGIFDGWPIRCGCICSGASITSRNSSHLRFR